MIFTAPLYVKVSLWQMKVCIIVDISNVSGVLDSALGGSLDLGVAYICRFSSLMSHYAFEANFVTLGTGPWSSSHLGGSGGERQTMGRAAQACGQSVLSEALTVIT